MREVDFRSSRSVHFAMTGSSVSEGRQPHMTRSRVQDTECRMRNRARGGQTTGNECTFAGLNVFAHERPSGRHFLSTWRVFAGERPVVRQFVSNYRPFKRERPADRHFLSGWRVFAGERPVVRQKVST